MSYGVYLANQLEGRISTLERQLAEQAEQLRQKDERILALAKALVVEVGSELYHGHIQSCPNREAPGESCSTKCRRIAALLEGTGTGL